MSYVYPTGPNNYYGPGRYYWHQDYYWPGNNEETVTETVETCEYDANGNLLKKTVKTTTRSRPRGYWAHRAPIVSYSNVSGNQVKTTTSLQSSSG